MKREQELLIKLHTLTERLLKDDNEIKSLLSTLSEVSDYANIGNVILKKVLEQSDRSDMLRIIEDLIDVLVDKEIISFNDLPEAAVKKLRIRKELRSKILEWKSEDKDESK